MKRMVLVVLALFVFSSAGFAQPDTGYVGLFTDVAHTTFTKDYSGAVTPFTMYIFWLAPTQGINAVEFAVTYPANVIGSTVTTNAGIVVSLGTLPGGISCAWAAGDCQLAGVWVESHHQSCFLTSAALGLIEVVAHPVAGGPQIASCELGYPIYQVKKYTNLCLNQTCEIAVQDATWGAIKSIF